MFCLQKKKFLFYNWSKWSELRRSLVFLPAMFVHQRLVDCVLARIDVRPATERSNFDPNMVFENVVRFAHVKSKAA
jgi:hypothetical protein